MRAAPEIALNALGEGPNEQQVRRQLAHIIVSPQFAGAPKLARFLRYVVETALDGKGEQIKESLIAVDVYGRRPDYNPQIDSTVRVEAGRLRARLKQYYECSGHDQPIEIELPKGTYVPVFRERAVCPPSSVQPDASSSAPPIESKMPRRAWQLPAALVLSTVGLLLFFRQIEPALDRNVRKTADAASAAAPSDPETARLYLRAHELLRLPVLKHGTVREIPASVFEAVRSFEEVTRRDERFAQGWAGLAEAYEWLYELDRHKPPERLLAAKAAAERAVTSNPSLPEAWSVLTSVLFFREWDIPAAEAACRRAVELNPRDDRAQERLIDLLRLQERFDEASRAIDHAVSVRPSAPNLRNRKALLLLDHGRFEEAIAEAAAAEALNPNRQQMAYTMSLWIQADAHHRQGRLDEAERLYRKACAYQPHDRWSESALGYLLGQTGRKREAVAILDELKRQVSLGRPQHKAIALVHLGLGERQEALRWLDRGYAERATAVLFVGLDPRFDDLRSEAGFRALLARIRHTVRPVSTLAHLAESLPRP